MKIFEVCLSDGWGGLEMYSQSLAFGLFDKGYEVFFLVKEKSKLANDTIRKMGEQNKNKVLGLENDLSNKINVVSFNSTKPFNVELIMELRKLLKKIKPEIIHIHVSSNLWPVRVALFGLKIRPNICFTDHMASTHPKKDILHRWLYKKLDYGIATTERGKKLMLDFTPLPENKIRVIPYGIDIKKYSEKKRAKTEARKKHNLPVDGIIIGQVSRLDPKKGQLEFLRAAEIILNEEKGKIFFVIAGGVDPVGPVKFEEELGKFVRERKLDGKIFFLGHQENIPEILSCLDIFVFPTHSEAFGLVILEAQSAGLPVIATAAGGIPEIITHKETGLLVKPEDGINLSEGIKRLLSDDELRKKISIQGRNNVLEKYSFENHLKKIIELYRSRT